MLACFSEREEITVWTEGSCYNIYMTREQLLQRQIRSMARSMEVEGANFHEMEKIMLDRLQGKRSRKKS